MVYAHTHIQISGETAETMSYYNSLSLIKEQHNKAQHLHIHLNWLSVKWIIFNINLREFPAFKWDITSNVQIKLYK